MVGLEGWDQTVEADVRPRSLEAKADVVVEADVDAFRKVAQAKIWPAYKSQFGGLWDQIADFKA